MQAFPVTWEMNGEMVADPGMALRDYFAAKAMPIAYESCTHNIKTAKERLGLGEEAVWNPYKHNPQLIAMTCYEIADAMLEERLK